MGFLKGSYIDDLCTPHHPTPTHHHHRHAVSQHAPPWRERPAVVGAPPCVPSPFAPFFVPSARASLQPHEPINTGQRATQTWEMMSMCLYRIKYGVQKAMFSGSVCILNTLYMSEEENNSYT